MGIPSRPNFQIQPLTDPRWEAFLGRNPRASVFHSRAWLQSLYKTYGYEPLAHTTSAPDQCLENAIVTCVVESWITGRRLVSVPFSDHCEALTENPEESQELLSALEAKIREEQMLYVELRPLDDLKLPSSLIQTTQVYAFHKIDLTPGVDFLFSKFHKDSTQRKIKRAEKEKLTYSVGRSESFLDHFYELFIVTRRRHGIPPQPKAWFRNLIESFGDALKIRIAFQGDRAVASILTIKFKDTLMYKYGCSDTRYNNLGGMHLLFWRSIQEAKEEGLCLFDLGRSESENKGLIKFKERWGATGSKLTYTKYHLNKAASAVQSVNNDWKLRIAKQVFSHTPKPLLVSAGKILYRHIG
jgi:lipid II:glycine glycyltransferase (peptidoglycan interpeptide bridge formation enzyme)